MIDAMIDNAFALARLALGGAIEGHQAAAEGTANALKNLNAARGFIRSIEGRLADFTDLDSRISRERADAIKEALAKGEAPSMAVSPELAQANAERLEVENQLSAARQAASSLAGDHAQAQAAEGAAKQEVQNAVLAVAKVEAAAIAMRLREIQAEEIELTAKLMAAEMVWINGKPLPLGRDVTDAICAPLAKDLVGTRNTPAELRFRRLRSDWDSFIARLAIDADAVLEEVSS